MRFRMPPVHAARLTGRNPFHIHCDVSATNTACCQFAAARPAMFVTWSVAQVSGTYGRGTAETIVENCANTLILRCSASEQGGTSEFASKLIGQREVLHTTLSRTRRPLHWFASKTSSEHLKIEPAVMASEIERLPDLTGFVKLASVPDWLRVILTTGNERPPTRLWRVLAS